MKKKQRHLSLFIVSALGQHTNVDSVNQGIWYLHNNNVELRIADNSISGSCLILLRRPTIFGPSPNEKTIGKLIIAKRFAVVT
jgi:hypothetical protein